MRKEGWRSGSGGFNFEGADFFSDLGVEGLFSQGGQIGIAPEPLEIGVTQADGLEQGDRGAVELAGQGIAASEVVMGIGIGRPRSGHFLIDLEALAEATEFGVVVPQDVEGLDIAGISADQSLEEVDFDIEITDFLAG